MRKLLLSLSILFLSAASTQAQCVQTCSNYAATSISYAPQYTGGNSLSLNDDELSIPIPIGFNFNFMCSNYNQMLVSSNGFITFDLAGFDDGCCSGGVLPTPGSTPNNLIAFTWNDLDPSTGGTITYTTLGVSPNQVFILTYSAIPHCCGNPSPNNTGQIKLFQTSNLIEIHSEIITNDGSNSTQGIEDSTATIGVATPSANSAAYTTSNTAYRFAHVAVPTPPSAVSGPTSVCSGSSYNFSVAPNPGATSYSWSLPGGWTGTSTTNVISATAGTAGVISVAATYTCGTSSTSDLTVAVSPGPTISVAGYTVVNCPGTTLTLTASGANSYSWSTGATTATIAPSPTANTTYTAYGTSTVNACVGNAVVTVTVHPALTMTTSGPATTICAGTTVTLTASGAATYTWNPSNVNGGMLITTPTVSTNYTVNATSANGCPGSAVISVTVSNCVGINNQSAELKNVSVYPNPNTGEFVVELKSGAKKSIEVYDMMGRNILSASGDEDKMDINISSFANGIYYVKIQSEDVFRVIKIVKE